AEPDADGPAGGGPRGGGGAGAGHGGAVPPGGGGRPARHGRPRRGVGGPRPGGDPAGQREPAQDPAPQPFGQRPEGLLAGADGDPCRRPRGGRLPPDGGGPGPGDPGGGPREDYR